VPTGGDLLARGLGDAGVDIAFGLPGVHNLAAWKALASSDVRLVGVRHEQTAAYAADGYARATGRVGVALTTTGPAAANTLGAVGEAWAPGSPGHPCLVDLHTPDFAALARSFGVRADTVDGLGEEFGALLADHVARDEPTVLVAEAALEPPPTTSPRWYRRPMVVP
jgi:thiamine pyrophosphate-dependent acetolactate synthase large subunit-like protein